VGAGDGCILILNVGSSSLRAVAFDAEDLAEVDRTELRWVEDSGEAAGRHGREAETLLRDHAWPGPVRAVGHRVVHAGAVGPGARRIDAEVRSAITTHAHLAPLHNPAVLAVIAAAERALPGAVPVAVFDSAFHATMPPRAALYAVPWRWSTEFGIRRLGFHGLSHAYASRRAAEMLSPADPQALRVVVCHLGGGCSLCACAGGRSVNTTMGFTPLDGLPMATRCGALDPGVVLELLRRGLYDVEGLGRALDREAGLKGLFGRSGDMRQVLAAREAGEPRAALAFDIYTAAVRRGIAAMAADLGGLEAVVFTGGVGEHAPAVREGAVAGLAWAGLRLEPDRNRAAVPDCDVSADGSAVRILVVAAREEWMAAEEVRRLLAR
jgi:acetate kinase